MSRPTDEELAKIAYRAYHNGDDALWSDDDDYEYWLAVARALRAALAPPVTPLAPGETVTIPAVYGTTELRESYGCLLLQFPADASQNEIAARRVLDAAGVAQLIATARRWQAAQGEGE